MGLFTRKKSTAIIQNNGFYGMFESADTCCGEEKKGFFKRVKTLFQKSTNKEVECCNGMPQGTKYAIAIAGIGPNGPYGGAIRACFVLGDRRDILAVGNTREISGQLTSSTIPSTNGPHVLSHVDYDSLADVTYFRSPTLTYANFPFLMTVTTPGFIKF